MKVLSVLSVAFLCGLGLLSPAEADGQTPSHAPERSGFMRVYGIAQPPYGFVLFCNRMPRECADTALVEQRMPADADRLSELDTVNRTVNREIEPATDMEIYGQTEYWTIPTDRGDCEDYALLKRKRLMARGWPASALLMTVVRDEKGEGHAVLTARTQIGDLILDNKNDEVKPWYRTPYRYVMRQSYLDPRVWMSLDPAQANTPVPLAGVRNR